MEMQTEEKQRDVTGMSADRSLMYCNFVICEGREWFWSTNYGALFGREISSCKVKRVGRFFKDKNNAYGNVISFDKKIIAMPCGARKIMIFDIDKNEFRFVEVEIPDINEEGNLFYGYVIADEYLFMVGNQFPYVLKFNMRTERAEKIVNLIPEEKREVYFREAVLYGNELIIPAVEDALIFEVNIETLQWEKRKIRQSMGGFSAVCKDESSIWLLPKDRGAVLQWNKKRDMITEHEIEETGFRYTPFKPNFHSCSCLNNKVWMFPFYGSAVLSFDLETGEMSKDNAINRYLETAKSPHDECKFRAVQTVSGNIRLLCCGTGKLIVYNPREDKLEICERENMLSNAGYLDWLYERSLIHIIKEGEFSAEEFTDFIISRPMETKEIKKQEADNCGFRIYQKINSV